MSLSLLHRQAVLYEKTEQLLIEMQSVETTCGSIQSRIGVFTEYCGGFRVTSYSMDGLHQFIETAISLTSNQYFYCASRRCTKNAIAMVQAQLALMFEREQLESYEQFVELKREAWFLLQRQDHAPCSIYSKSVLSKFYKVDKLWLQVVIKPLNLNYYFPNIYWRTDNHHSACCHDFSRSWAGVFFLSQMLNENPQLKATTESFKLFRFHTQSLNILSIWSGIVKTWLGLGCSFFD